MMIDRYFYQDALSRLKGDDFLIHETENMPCQVSNWYFKRFQGKKEY